MDVGASNGWNMSEVLPSEDVVALIAEHFPLAPLEAHSAAETAQRWRYRDGSGEIGVISSVTRAFCDSCTRARLSTEGKLYLCLFATSGHDLRGLIRSGASDATVATAIARIWEARADNYSQLRGSSALPPVDPDAPRVEMSYIGRFDVAHAHDGPILKSDITGVVLAGGQGSRNGRRRQKACSPSMANRSRCMC